MTFLFRRLQHRMWQCDNSWSHLKLQLGDKRQYRYHNRYHHHTNVSDVGERQFEHRRKHHKRQQHHLGLNSAPLPHIHDRRLSNMEQCRGIQHDADVFGCTSADVRRRLVWHCFQHCSNLHKRSCVNFHRKRLYLHVEERYHITCAGGPIHHCWRFVCQL